LGCNDRFEETARAVISTRLNEVAELRTAIISAEQSQDLHDLRIAAKRLRYSLDMFAVCFPPKTAHEFADRVRDVQDVLGRIHDLDVLNELLHQELRSLDDHTRENVVERLQSSPAGVERDVLLRSALRRDAQRGARAGLYRIIAAKLDERARKYDEFAALWDVWERDDVVGQIRAMISIPVVDAGSP
jgi:CHAD domain-containing protein